MVLRLDRSAWMRAARLALLHEGPQGVRVEPLARALGVTKGSFYWHFRDRAELLEELISEWEGELDMLHDAVGAKDRRAAFLYVIDEVERRTHGSERGDWPSDAAVYAWAGIEPSIAKRVRRIERARMELLRELLGHAAEADFIYYAYQGLMQRRRREPSAMKDYPSMARVALALLDTVATAKDNSPPSSRSHA